VVILLLFFRIWKKRKDQGQNVDFFLSHIPSGTVDPKNTSGHRVEQQCFLKRITIFKSVKIISKNVRPNYLHKT
jgi:hypothetical protein